MRVIYIITFIYIVYIIFIYKFVLYLDNVFAYI